MHTTFFQIGRLHVPVFGVFVAAGLMAALGMSQRTARYAGLGAERVWNAGMTAVIAAFAISRLLLVVYNLRSFVEYPLLVLTLPSLTGTGVVLTGIFMLAYLRWRRVPLVALLDAMAPCAALLWAFVNAGRIAEGTKDGMPAKLPWGVGDRMMGMVHPVEIYTLIAAVVLCVGLLWMLLRVSVAEGTTAGVGLMFAGLTAFFVDFFRLPSQLVAETGFELVLDPAQIIGFAMILAGGALVYRAVSRLHREKRNEEAHAV